MLGDFAFVSHVVYRQFRLLDCLEAPMSMAKDIIAEY